ncbi:MAG: phage holin family protein [Ewingella sp.]|uniref:phage holin family protein n=1 Tax=Dryocola clanedunensis TaxID=2925396 RepID=UPI0022F0A2AD|nr:phage holin family protein [Dryocola clanedunensis]MCT4713236.1 phage holin family protein [Dryocola clanedunensis]MDN5681337.1 phage holin family protein [Ewingella sp.]
MLNDILLAINFVVCSAIFIVLFHFARDGARFRRGISFLAMLLMVSAGAIPIMIGTGLIRQTSIPHTILAITLLVVVINARGNITRLAKPFSR